MKSLVLGLLTSLFVLVTITSICIAVGRPLDTFIFCTTTIAPVMIATPCWAIQLSQAERIKSAKRELERLYAVLDKRAQTDGLTGVLNRETFVGRLMALSSQGVSGALLYIDLDFFKQVNDRFGHVTGDRALRVVGETLIGQFRAEDIVGRIGGEEFAVFLIGMQMDLAADRAERLRACAPRSRGR